MKVQRSTGDDSVTDTMIDLVDMALNDATIERSDCADFTVFRGPQENVILRDDKSGRRFEIVLHEIL